MKVNFNITLFYSVLFVQLFFSQCKHQEKDIDQNMKHPTLTHTLEPTKVNLSIKIDSTTPPTSVNLKLTLNDQILAYFNNLDNSILFIDLEQKRISNRVKIANNGPDAVGKIRSFFAINIDSIYIIPQHKKQIFLVNKYGKILKRYSLPASPFFQVNNTFVDYLTPFSVKGDTAVFGTFPFVDIDDTKNLYKQKLVCKYNLRNGEAVEGIVQYPSTIYSEGKIYGYKHLHYSYCLNDSNELIFSFGADPYISVYDKHKKIKQYQANSSLFENFIKPISNRNISSDGYEKYDLETPGYSKMFFDKYRKVYYRFCYKGLENFSGKIDLKTYFSRENSILMLNKNYKIIGEYKLPNNVYNLNNCFLDKQGLWLSTNNINNSTLREKFYHSSFLP